MIPKCRVWHQEGVKFLHRSIYKKIFKNTIWPEKLLITCVEASSGSLDLNLFNYDPRGWGRATMKGESNFYVGLNQEKISSES